MQQPDNQEAKKEDQTSGQNPQASSSSIPNTQTPSPSLTPPPIGESQAPDTSAPTPAVPPPTSSVQPPAVAPPPPPPDTAPSTDLPQPVPPPPPPKGGLLSRFFRKKEAFQSVSDIKKQPATPLNAAPAGQSPLGGAQPPAANTQPPAAPPPPPSTPPTAPSRPISKQAEPPSAPKAPPPSSAIPAAPIGKTAIITRRPKRIKTVLGIILGLALASVAVFFFFFYRVQLNISPAGGADKITLDGKEIPSGLQKVMPGVHSIVISKDGYITYRQSENFKINQRLNITFPLEKATVPTLVESGGTDVSAANTTKLIYYQLSDGRIASAATEAVNNQFKGFPITNGAYPNAKKILYSDDEAYALIQSPDGIKAVSFNKADVVNQVEANLPLDSTKVEAITWNTGTSSYVTTPNSKVIYDLKGENIWSLMLSDTNFAKTEILMRLDTAKFSNLVLDWSNSPKKVLVVGSSAGVLDIATRHWEEIISKDKLVWGGWGPKGKYGIILNDNDESYLLKDYQLTKLDLKTKPQLISWSSDSKAIIISDGHPVGVDFDTNERINYAEINGLKNAVSATVQKGRLFFSDGEGVKTAPLTENIYPMAKVK